MRLLSAEQCCWHTRCGPCRQRVYFCSPYSAPDTRSSPDIPSPCECVFTRWQDMPLLDCSQRALATEDTPWPLQRLLTLPPSWQAM